MFEDTREIVLSVNVKLVELVPLWITQSILLAVCNAELAFPSAVVILVLKLFAVYFASLAVVAAPFAVSSTSVIFVLKLFAVCFASLAVVLALFAVSSTSVILVLKLFAVCFASLAIVLASSAVPSTTSTLVVMLSTVYSTVLTRLFKVVTSPLRLFIVVSTELTLEVNPCAVCFTSLTSVVIVAICSLISPCSSVRVFIEPFTSVSVDFVSSTVLTNSFVLLFNAVIALFTSVFWVSLRLLPTHSNSHPDGLIDFFIIQQEILFTLIISPQLIPKSLSVLNFIGA